MPALDLASASASGVLSMEVDWCKRGTTAKEQQQQQQEEEEEPQLEEDDEESGTEEVARERRRLQQHFVELREHLVAELVGFGELDLALTEVAELEERCLHCGMSADILEVLDEAVAASAASGAPAAPQLPAKDAPGDQEDEELDLAMSCTLEIEGGGGRDAEEAEVKAEMLACAGSYLAVFNHTLLAAQQFQQALEANPLNFHAQLGQGKIVAERFGIAHRSGTPRQIQTLQEEAMEAAFRAARLLIVDLPYLPKEEHEKLRWERQVAQCLHLLDGVLNLVSPLCLASSGDACSASPAAAEHHQTTFSWRPGSGKLPDVLELLPFLVAFLHTPAAPAIESIARRRLAPPPWLPQPLESLDVVQHGLPTYLEALLMHSQAFCHVVLEQHAARWRCSLSHAVLAAAIDVRNVPLDGDVWSRPLLRAAAAVACHCHLVGYCIQHAAKLQEAETLHVARNLLEEWNSNPAERSESCASLAWLVVVLYEEPLVHPPAAIFASLPAPSSSSSSRLLPGGCEEDHPVEELLNRVVKHPQQEAMLAEEATRVVGSGGGTLPDTPCRGFYDNTLYPPWHRAVESVGSLPVRLEERIKQLYPWRHWMPPSESWGRRPCILVAGCGSGHQLAVELRTYSNCDIVALDCSVRAVARAQRKLEAVLNAADFARVRFVVADIMELSGAEAFGVEEGFDLVICCAVLHHLRDPTEGLRRLASVLLPGGILQLATYSSISVSSWREPVLLWMQQASSSVQHLFDSSTGALLRTPTQDEVRAFRQEVLNLQKGNEVHDLLVHFREFYTLAGILDLLFHPLERTFTLAELSEGPIQSAGLIVLGVFFPDVNVDLAARRKFRSTTGPGVERDARMVDLLQWHKLEQEDPDLFGRMHTLFLERPSAVDCLPESSADLSSSSSKRRKILDGSHVAGSA